MVKSLLKLQAFAVVRSNGEARFRPGTGPYGTKARYIHDLASACCLRNVIQDQGQGPAPELVFGSVLVDGAGLCDQRVCVPKAGSKRAASVPAGGERVAVVPASGSVGGERVAVVPAPEKRGIRDQPRCSRLATSTFQPKKEVSLNRSSQNLKGNSVTDKSQRLARPSSRRVRFDLSGTEGTRPVLHASSRDRSSSPRSIEHAPAFRRGPILLPDPPFLFR